MNNRNLKTREVRAVPVRARADPGREKVTVPTPVVAKHAPSYTGAEMSSGGPVRNAKVVGQSSKAKGHRCRQKPSL